LTAIRTQKQLTAKQSRWIQFLDEFNFQLVHTPGSKNQVADALSRAGINTACVYGITTLVNENWKQALREITAKITPPHRKKMVEVDGLLRYNGRIYVPGDREIRTIILREVHEALGGHLGEKKTFHKVEESYYWETLRRDVKKFVQSCDICQKV